MTDKISIERIMQLHPLVVQAALDAYQEIGCALTGRALCRVQEGLRTFEVQEGYYALGRTKVNPDGKSKTKPMGNIITNAKPGTSYHQYGLALDYVLLVGGTTLKWDVNGDYDGDHKADWIEIADIFKKHGFNWGGDWRTFVDMPHVEMTFDYKTAELLAKYNAKEFIPGTKYLFLAPTVLIQRALKIKDDGIFGKGTLKAVKEFQAANGLKSDGIVGYTTAVKLGLYK